MKFLTLKILEDRLPFFVRIVWCRCILNGIRKTIFFVPNQITPSYNAIGGTKFRLGVVYLIIIRKCLEYWVCRIAREKPLSLLGNAARQGAFFCSCSYTSGERFRIKGAKQPIRIAFSKLRKKGNSSAWPPPLVILVHQPLDTTSSPCWNEMWRYPYVRKG
jgi:hypothetical protein